ncbi:MAG: filamentous hemagglutinin N-terminal domain-containing protein [Candidatus Omnitrophota bacterium]
MKRSKKVCLFILIALSVSTTLFALPEGQEVESGTATFQQPNENTLIITADDKAVINFNSFDIAPNETVTFNQPTNTSSVLSRIIGGSYTDILGNLNANGRLFLTNAFGIHFGPSANINVNTLVASTLSISTNNFINDNYELIHSKDNPFSQVLNEGTITGDNIALIGSSVENTGIITATAGAVHLTTGDRVTVAFDKKGLIQIVVDEEVTGEVFDFDGVRISDSIKNTGTVEAGSVIMTVDAAEDIFENAVNLDGVVKTTELVEVDGVLKVVASGDITLTGKLTATGNKDITIDTPGEMALNGTISTEYGAIKIGETTAPSKITGSPTYIHTKGDIVVEEKAEDGSLSTLKTARGSILRYDTTGGVSLKATSGSVIDLTLTPIEASTLSITGNAFSISTDVDTLLLYKNTGDLLIDSVLTINGIVLLEGDDVSASYSEATDVTLKSNGLIDTQNSAILTGNSLTLIGDKFGTTSSPINIDANSLHLKKLNGDIQILEMLGIGSNILFRGPPTGFGAILCNATTNLTLEALNGNIISTNPSTNSLLITESGTTLVTTSLVANTQVLSFDLTNNQTTYNTVTDIDLVIDGQFYILNNRTVLHGHQTIMLTNGYGKHVQDLEIGDQLVGYNGQTITLTDFSQTQGDYTFYRLSVDNDHTYYLDGLLMHNASRYWVGGGSSTNWGATGNTNWGTSDGVQDNASVPTSTDDALFTSTFVGDCVIAATANCANLTFTGGTGYTGTLSGSSALNIYGSLTLDAGMTLTASGTWTFASTAAGKTVTANGITATFVPTFDGVGGVWTLQDAFDATGKTITLTRGTLDTNGKTVTCATFDADNSNTRTLTLGASTINCNDWDTNTITNLTFNADTSTINVTTSGSFYSGGLTFNDVNFTSSGTVYIYGANTFANLTRTGTASKTDELKLREDQIITGTLTINGNSATNRLLVCSYYLGTSYTLTAAVVSVSNANFMDITGAGAGDWDLSGATGGSGDCLGNTNIDFTTADDLFWVDNNGGNWSATTSWSTSSGGASGARVPPTAG